MNGHDIVRGVTLDLVTTHQKATMAAELPDVIDEDILCCHLCLRPMLRPKLLPCLHLYCESCLRNYVRRWARELPGRFSASRALDNEHYLTFPDTPKSDKDDKDNVFLDSPWKRKDNECFSFQEKSEKSEKPKKASSPKRSPRRSNNRRSGASDDGSVKRFQQPERYMDRDTLAHCGAVYRERYRQSQILKDAQQAEKPQSCDTQDRKNRKTLQSTEPSHCERSGDDQTTKNKSEAKKTSGRKEFKRAMSSPLNKAKPSLAIEEDMPLSGKVSSIVNIYEQKSSSASSREATPPLAMFRQKTPTSEPKAPFVPLSQRPLPAFKGHKAIGPASRSLSVDSFPISRNLSLCPSNKSLNNRRNDIVGASEKADPPSTVVPHQNAGQRNSITEENHYEGYEFPQSDKNSMTGNRQLDKNLERNSNVYELAKSVDTLPKQGHTLKTGGIKRAKSPTPNLRIPPSQSPPQPLGPDMLGGRDRPVSITENIYYEIPEHRHSRLDSMRASGSVPDLLAEVNKDSSRPGDVKRRRLRRSSSSLDSYVMAADLTDRSDDLNRRVPLSSDDSQRLSQLYMRMDGVRSNQLLSQTSYIAMDKLSSPGIGSPNVFTPESIGTLIQALSNEFHGHSGQERVSVEEDLRSIKSSEPPVYANDQEEEGEEEELDVPIPLYEAGHTDPNYVNHNYYNASQVTKEETREYKPNKDIQVPCPTCDRLFFLPKGDVSALQDCSYAAQIQEVVQTQKCETKQCGHCDNKRAQHKCLDCQLYLCVGCQNGHSWVRANQGHKVITLQQLQSGKYQQEIKQRQVTKCDLGCGNKGKHFCAQCDLVLCSDCLLQHSRHHQSCPLEQVAHRENDFIQSMTETLQTRQEVFQGALDNLSNYQNHCRESCQRVLDDIKGHQEYLYLLLDRSFDFLRSRVTKEYKVELSKSETLKSDVTRNLSSMNYVSNFVRQLTEHGNHGNIVSMAKSVKEEISRLQTMTPKVMESQVKVKLKAPELTLQHVQPLCGDISMDSDPISKTNVSLNRQMTQLVEHHTHQMELLTQFTTRLEGDKKGCRPNGVSVAPHRDMIAIVDDINKKLKAFTTRGKLLWEICPTDKDALRDPWDVVILENGTLAVTDKGSNDVKIFTNQGALVTAFGAHLKKPWGITQNSKGAIIVTDVELSKVFIHDSLGRLLYTLPHPPSPSDLPNDISSHYTLKCPEYVCCNRFDDIIISDFENHRIMAFDCLGRPLFKFGKKGKGMDEFYYPLGIATDHHGNIFVVNYQNQRITVVTRNGQFLCCLTSKVTLHSMQTLSINKEGHLVVVDGSYLKIFKLPQSIVGNSDKQSTRQQRPNQKTAFTFQLSQESNESGNTTPNQETAV